MEANPKSIGMQDVLYDQSVAAGDWEGMEQATRASLAIRGDARHYSRLGNILSSRPAPDYSGAAQAYEQAVALAPTSGDDWAALAHIRVHMLKDYSGGALAGEKAVAINKDNGGTWCDLALARHQLLDVEGSIAAATHASELNKSVECRVLLAQLKLGKNDFAGALELVTAAVADATLDTDKAWAQNVQAAALLNTGKVDEALEGFQNANAVLKDDPEHNLWYGYALQRKGDFSQALDQFNAAMANGRSSGSPLGMQVAADAAKASKSVAKLAKSSGKGNVEVVKDNRRNEQPREEANRKPAPPVIEENGNNKDEAVPAQVPGPR
jgi:tetratricopeptide (TPR) repeat protein